MDDDISFIMGSNLRQDVLLALFQNKMTVVQLSNFLHKHPTALYRIVKELTDRGLLTHNNVARYRIYQITNKGIEVLKEIDVIK